MKRGRYYLGRVIKTGLLDQAKLLDAIANAKPIATEAYSWAFTEVKGDSVSGHNYIYGRLVKFSTQGQVTLVDTKSKTRIPALAENLEIASSPFIYLPEFSGLAFLHVWNHIEENTFRLRFKQIIENMFDHFFVECTVEPISDYKAFVLRLRELTSITEISAVVHPPNPLYGRLWDSLRQHMQARNSSELSIKEGSNKRGGLRTEIVKLIDRLLKKPDYAPDKPPSVADASLMMAADGYGKGKVIGVQGVEEVVIRTTDAKKSFMFQKDPVPDALATEAAIHFNRISEDRGLRH